MTIINKEDFKIKKELNRPILSLDYGEKRIGIAISDNECSIALPSEVLERNNTQKNFVSYLNLSEGHTAYIIGNGTSRQGLDLNVLKGDIWGCNALYRDYTPDYLTIIDVSIMGECCQSTYPKYNHCYFSGEWDDPLGFEEYNVIKEN